MSAMRPANSSEMDLPVSVNRLPMNSTQSERPIRCRKECPRNSRTGYFGSRKVPPSIFFDCRTNSKKRATASARHCAGVVGIPTNLRIRRFAGIRQCKPLFGYFQPQQFFRQLKNFVRLGANISQLKRNRKSLTGSVPNEILGTNRDKKRLASSIHCSRLIEVARMTAVAKALKNSSASAHLRASNRAIRFPKGR